jgi:iron(III) transport system substrate-binding protein
MKVGLTLKDSGESFAQIATPACWRNLAKPEFVGEIQMANPNASGTAYTAMATIVQLFGDEEAFKYMKAPHGNINGYPRSGVGPTKAVARGTGEVPRSAGHANASTTIRPT